MCGRQRCTLGGDTIQRVTRVPSRRWIDMDRYRSSYNVAPGFYTPVVRMVNRDQSNRERRGERGRGGDGERGDSGRVGEGEGMRGEGEREGEGEGEGVGEREGGGERDRGEGERERVVQCMKWGLVPSFTKKSEKPDYFRMFNARSESVHEKASFRRLLPRNRCLVLSEGFYEWKKDGSKKQPYYIYLKNEEPLVFAGLYDRWEDAQGDIMYTYTVLTTRVSKRLEWLHDRMPVILNTEESREAWLEGELKLGDIVKLTQPYEEMDLFWHSVTPEMGKLSVDGPQCITELKASKESAIKNFFKKQTPNMIEGKTGGKKGEIKRETKGDRKGEEKRVEYHKEDEKPFIHVSRKEEPLKGDEEEVEPFKPLSEGVKPFKHEKEEGKAWQEDERKGLKKEETEEVVRNSEGQLPSFEVEEEAKKQEKSFEVDNKLKDSLNEREDISEIEMEGREKGGENEGENKQKVVNMEGNTVLLNHEGKKHPREVTNFDDSGRERKNFRKTGSSMENFSMGGGSPKKGKTRDPNKQQSLLSFFSKK